jgi:hypothetical protein
VAVADPVGLGLAPNRPAHAMSPVAAALLETDIGRDIQGIDEVVVGKLRYEPVAAADFIFREEELVLPYGVPRERIFGAWQSPSKIASDDLVHMKDAGNVSNKLGSISNNDLPKYADGLIDMLSGGGQVFGDLFATEETFGVMLLSIPGGIRDFAQGWKKFFSS